MSTTTHPNVVHLALVTNGSDFQSSLDQVATKQPVSFDTAQEMWISITSRGYEAILSILGMKHDGTGPVAIVDAGMEEPIELPMYTCKTIDNLRIAMTLPK